MRPSGRHVDELRKIEIELQVNKHAEGSCLIKCGNTHVLCTATVENKVPPFLRGQGKGWVTAEYGMLPRATGRRMERESVRGGQAGRTQEIQRLIGRSLRAVTDLNSLGERQIIVDCDVIQADGGTRCASITGGYVALYMAISKLMRTGQLENMPLYTELAAVSCGIYRGKSILDLDYDEDSEAEVDANFIMTSSGGIVEIQGTAEGAPFGEEQLMEMMGHAKKGIGELVALQQKVLRIT